MGVRVACKCESCALAMPCCGRGVAVRFGAEAAERGTLRAAPRLRPSCNQCVQMGCGLRGMRIVKCSAAIQVVMAGAGRGVK